jgi:hypothetical protein
MPRAGACFYENANFGGQYFCGEPGDDLGTLPGRANDRVSSIRLLGPVTVVVFRDALLRGPSLQFTSNVRDLQAEGFNDVISSILIRRGGPGNRPGPNPDVIVRRAYQDILEREPDPSGLRTYRSHIIDDGWTEQQVREALRNSQEYRQKNTITLAKAQEIVRRAYLAVLKREPDPGSRGFVDKVLREKWTQQDVERELRKSPEYKNKR